MSKHTKEPWNAVEVDNDSDTFVKVCHANGGTIAKLWIDVDDKEFSDEQRENARRIVACVNACEGMDDPVEVIKGLKEALARTTHQVITCGVAARHPDANLSRRESDYGGKWDSPQAESVRQLRKERDELLDVQKDHHRLVRELDALLNGVDGAAHQASLCDLVAQLKSKGGAA
ncbi:hypothetical protein [Aeromonas veronii]|uniref:hypothetical protein n=1 Tax=Aeromonas veronii TaxID=654 RepID=UPI001239A863|nr:hypothetical protein [Aeromonas veronii]QET79844.1 hypothetical protein FOB40_11575 [Aeromonas veronii]